MKQTTKRIWDIAICCILLTTSTYGDGLWTVKNCWDNRADAPETKLSDLGEVRFLSHARVATLDAQLEARLARIKASMSFGRRPEKVALGEEEIPSTLVDAANYLDRHVCMAYPPILCVETEDAFFFSGGRSTNPVYDFGSGMAIMKRDGAIWIWDHVEEEAEPPTAE